MYTLVVIVVVGCRGGGWLIPSYHELRPSLGPVLNPYPHNGVCVCVCIGTRPRCPHMRMHMRVLWGVFVQFILVRRSHCASRSTTLAIPSQPTHTGRGVSRPVKSRSYRHSGRTDSTHRCCYERYQRSQFTEDNAEPFFLPAINSLCQFTVPRNILRSPMPTTPMWARFTILASQLASSSQIGLVPAPYLLFTACPTKLRKSKANLTHCR